MKIVTITESAGVFTAWIKKNGQNLDRIRGRQLFALLDQVVNEHPAARFTQYAYKQLAPIPKAKQKPQEIDL